jgi:hypothetical protein
MADFLTYDGQTVVWWPDGRKFKATSGLIEKVPDAAGRPHIVDHQKPTEQCVRNAGPIPEGTYYLELQIDPRKYAVDDGTSRCNLRAAGPIQHIPRGGDPTRVPKGMHAGWCEDNWANWGWRRVRLEPADTKTAKACSPTRAGFYLHDSTKGYTHGCVEVEGAFFDRLIKFAPMAKQPRMRLTVKYTTASTYGGTHIPATAASP